MLASAAALRLPMSAAMQSAGGQSILPTTMNPSPGYRTGKPLLFMRQQESAKHADGGSAHMMSSWVVSAVIRGALPTTSTFGPQLRVHGRRRHAFDEAAAPLQGGTRHRTTRGTVGCVHAPCQRRLVTCRVCIGFQHEAHQVLGVSSMPGLLDLKAPPLASDFLQPPVSSACLACACEGVKLRLRLLSPRGLLLGQLGQTPAPALLWSPSVLSRCLVALAPPSSASALAAGAALPPPSTCIGRRNILTTYLSSRFHTF